MFRKLFAILAVAVWLVLGVVPGASAAPVTVTIGTMEYSVDPENPAAGATLARYLGSERSPAIPASVQVDGVDYPVTTIGHEAFFEKRLSTIVVPDSVTTIGVRAFADSKMSSLILGSSVTTIGDFACHNCGLSTLTLPDSVRTIGHYAFRYNYALSSVDFGNGVTYIGSWAFNQTQLAHVNIPDSVTTIDEHAFREAGVVSVRLGSGVTSIRLRAFDVNSNISSVRFTGPRPSVGTLAFARDSIQFSYPWRYGAPQTPGGYTATWPIAAGPAAQAIATVQFQTGSTTAIPAQEVIVGQVATLPTQPIRAGYDFTGWYTAASGGTLWDFAAPVTSDLTLHARWQPVVHTIGSMQYTVNPENPDAGATLTRFIGAERSPTIPDSIDVDGVSYPVTVIGAGAFGYRPLTSIVIPDSVTVIGNDAFVDTQLGSVTLGNNVTTIGSYAFHTANLRSLTLPDSLVSIGSYAFRYNFRLSTVDFGQGLKTIGIWAFNQTAIRDVILPDSVTVVGANSFREAGVVNVRLGSGVTNVELRAFDINYEISTVRFTGPRPTVAGDAFKRSSIQFSYPWRYGDPQTPGGYTATWPIAAGPPAQAIATVEFDPGTTAVIADQEVVVGQPATQPTAPSLAEHSLVGWFTAADGGTEWDFADPITGDVTLYAHWAPVTYMVTLQPGNGDVATSESVASGSTVTTIPEWEGRTFVGWFSEPTGGVNFTNAPVTAVATLYGQWTLNSYAVTLVPGNGDPDQLVTVEHGSPLPETAPIRIGHRFLGWFTAPTGGTEFTGPISGATTLYGQWSLNQHTVTLEPGNGDPETALTTGYGTTVAQPADPIRTGHAFQGWFAEPGTPWDFATLITADLMLTAGWQLNVYPVTLDPGTGDVPTLMNIEHGSPLPPVTPTRTGHTFIGWFTAATGGTEFTGPVTGPVTLHGQWSLNQHTVTLQPGNGDPQTALAAGYGTTVPQPADPVRAGHTFQGWFTGTERAAPWDFGTPVTADLVLTAAWELNVYPITLDPGTGDAPTLINIEHGSPVPPVAPSRIGHTFMGWFTALTGGTEITGPISGSTALFARWALNHHAVTFEVADGLTMTQTTAYGSALAGLPVPTRAGFTFAGWFTAPDSGSRWNPSDAVTADLTLYARWTQNPPVPAPDQHAAAGGGKALVTTGATSLPILASGVATLAVGATLVIARRAPRRSQ